MLPRAHSPLSDLYPTAARGDQRPLWCPAWSVFPGHRPLSLHQDPPADRPPGPWAVGLPSLGGEDFEQPLTISWVTPGIRAAVANFSTGDIVTAIDGENSSNVTHLAAQNKSKFCIGNVTLPAATSEHKIW